MTNAQGTEVDARPPVDLRRSGGVAIITLHNPPVGALAMRLVADLRDRITALAAEGASVLVIRSTVPGYFGAGAELKEVRGASPERFMAYVHEVRTAVDAVAACTFPTIAAVDGRALGGGLELALACDVRLASERARFGLPEIKIGLLPGAGGTQRLPSLIGSGPALELMLSGREIDLAEATRLGLATKAAGTANEAAIAWADRYCQGSTDAGEAITRCVHAPRAHVEEAGMQTEVSEIEALYRKGDASQRIDQFFAQRAG